MQLEILEIGGGDGFLIGFWRSGLVAMGKDEFNIKSSMCFWQVLISYRIFFRLDCSVLLVADAQRALHGAG